MNNMKHIVTFLMLCIAFLGYTQNPKLESINYKTTYTLAERDAMTLGVNDRKQIYVVDTGVNEVQIWDGDSWETVGGDNLGNHTLTEDLMVNNHNIDSDDDLSFQIDIDNNDTTSKFLFSTNGGTRNLLNLDELGYATFGVQDTNFAWIRLYGDNANQSGGLQIFNGANQDTNIDSYYWSTVNGNLTLIANGGTNGSSTPVFTVNSSTLQVGFGNYEWPRQDGTAGQVPTTDGSGNVTWQDAAESVITKTLINASSVTLLAADIENFNQFIIDPSQTNVTITIPPTVNPGGVLFLNIYNEGTGDITVQAGSGVTFTTQTFTNAKRVVLYSDTDDVWKVKEENTQFFGASTGIINLKDYGAVGDGVTDDTDAIAAAFVDLASNTDYHSLFVPKGTYITQAIGQNSTVPAYSGIGALSGKLIYGEGQYSIFKLKAGENTELFEWQFNTSAIKDIRFDGNNPTPAWGGALNNPNTDYLVKIRGYGIDLENVVAQFSGGDGIHIYGGVGVVDIRGGNSKAWFNWGYGYVIEHAVTVRMTSPWVEQNLLGGVLVTTTVTGTDNTWRQLNNIVIENLYYERVSSFPTDWVATYGQPKVVTIEGTNGVRVINPAFVLAPDDIHFYVKANTSSPAGYQGSNGNILELGAHSNINAVFDEQCNNNTIIRKSVTATNGAINITDNGNNNQVKWNLIENAISLKNDSDATVYGFDTNFAYGVLANAELKDGGFFDDNSDYHATSSAPKYVQLNPTTSTLASCNLYNNADLPINGSYYVVLIAKMSALGSSYIALEDALTNEFYNFETNTFGSNSPYYFKTDPSVNYYAIPFQTDGQNRKVRIRVYSSLTTEKSYLFHAFVADSKDVHLELKRSNVVVRKGEVKQATTAQLPPAANVRAGTEVYDTTINQLLYNNGSTWISGGVSDPLLLSDGTSSNATYSFGSDADVGIYKPATNTLGLTGGGAVARWNSTGFRSESTGDFYIRKAGSTAAAPMYSFWGIYDNAGMFRPVGLSEVAFSALGVERFRVGVSRNTHTVPIKPASYTVDTLPTGAEGDVAYVTDADTISYRAIAVGGGTGKALVFFDGTNWIYH